MVTTRPPKTIVKPTALGPVANTDTKLLIYGLFQKGRVLAQDGIGRWPDWPEREVLTGLNGRDIGIDFVARWTTGERVAIQCTCYEDRCTLGKDEIDKFLGGSQQLVFCLRWIVKVI